ncbi:MAG: hypothetical protein ACXAEU_26485, partial [Candidatus Hodarchaeales archaeon]
DQLLSEASRVFARITVKPTPIRDRTILYLTCIAVLLEERGSFITGKNFRAISKRTSYLIKYKNTYKYRIRVKQACIDLYGRERAMRAMTNRGPVIIKNYVREILARVKITTEKRIRIEKTACDMVDGLVAWGFKPKQFETHAYAALKNTCEELQIPVKRGKWDRFLGFDKKQEKAVMMAAFTQRKILVGERESRGEKKSNDQELP